MAGGDRVRSSYCLSLVNHEVKHSSSRSEFNQSEDRINKFSIDEDEENWSLVDLLSRSGSSQVTRTATTNSANSTNTFQQTPPIKKSNWLSEIIQQAHPLRESSNEESDEDLIGLFHSRHGSSSGQSISGSSTSISWAEDAVEAEQTLKLVHLWKDVENVCAGEPKPSDMTQDVFIECLLWQRAFPIESETQSSQIRFESIEDVWIDGEDSSTPTNDISESTTIVSVDSGKPIPIQLPNKDTISKDSVSDWLSKCHLNQSESNHSITPPNYKQVTEDCCSVFPNSSDQLNSVEQLTRLSENRLMTSTGNRWPIRIPLETSPSRVSSSKPFLLWLFHNSTK